LGPSTEEVWTKNVFNRSGYNRVVVELDPISLLLVELEILIVAEICEALFHEVEMSIFD